MKFKLILTYVCIEYNRLTEGGGGHRQTAPFCPPVKQE